MRQRAFDRREFLRRSAVAVAGGLGFWLHSRDRHPGRELAAAQSRDERAHPGSDLPALVVVSGGDPASLAAAALAALGGMQKFVSRGDVVVFKPNIGWDRVPQQAANTNPDLVQAVARLSFDAGAKKVVVTDVSCNDAR